MDAETPSSPDPARVGASPAMAGALGAALAEAGVRFLFGVPGGGNNLDVIGAAEASGIRFVLAHTETAAMMMAGIAAELDGTPGACVVTRGPGVTSAVNGVAQVQLDRQPVILVSDCVASSDVERVSHQRVDHARMLGTVTKATIRFGADDPAQAAREAIALATSGRPGPVHLDFDPTARTSDGDADDASGSWPDVFAGLERARRPVILVGVGVVARPARERAATVAAIRSFADAIAAPVLTTYRAKGVVPDSGPRAAGVLTGGRIEAPLLARSDLLIGIGLDPVELIPAPWPYEAPVVLIGPWPISDSSFFGACLRGQAVGDVAATLERLAGHLVSSWSGDEASVERSRALTRIEAAVPARPCGLTPQEIVGVARAAAPPGTIATVDAGAHMLAAMPLWHVEEPHEILISSGLATMGFALPAAIAAALARPDRRVICFTGDGGLGMVLGELETLVRLQLNVTVVVFNDATLSLIAIKQKPSGQGGLGAVRYGDTDFAAIARGFGMAAARAGDREDYETQLIAALGRAGPCLIDVAVDASAYGDLLAAIRSAPAPAPA